MNLSAMRRIDKYAGPFVGLALLGVVGIRKMFVPPVDRSPEAAVSNVLITKFFGLGSLLLASPAMRRLKSRHPAARLTVLTTTSNRRICEVLPAVDNVICVDVGSIFRFLSSYAAVMRAVHRIRPDVVIDLEFLTNFSAVTVLLARILSPRAMTYGFNAPVAWRNRAFDRTTVFDHSVHVMRTFLKTVDGLGDANLSDTEGEVDLSPETAAVRGIARDEFPTRLLHQHPALGACAFLICMNVNAGPLCLLRRWPLAHFQELISRLVRNPDIGIVLIGSSDEADYVGGLVADLPENPRIVNLCGQTPLEELVGLLARCDLVVTNDSGPLHLAYILARPTISFFGPETPRLYGPVGKDHVTLYTDMWCSPCINIYNSKMTTCRDNVCLQRITPQSVEAIIFERFLDRGAGDGGSAKVAHI